MSSCLRQVFKRRIGVTVIRRNVSDDVRGATRRGTTILSTSQCQLLEEQRDLVRRTQELRHSVNAFIGGDEPFSDDRLDYRPYQDIFEDVLKEKAEFSNQVMFSMVIAGEFNVGKSTFINALLGRKVLESGPLPTTDAVHIVTSATKDDDGNGDGGEVLSNGFVLHRLDIEDTRENEHGISSSSRLSDDKFKEHSSSSILNEVLLVDTPGLNAVASGHEEITNRLLPSADLIVFVTSSERPFTESERTFLNSIQAYRKQLVIVVNKIDILDSAGGDYGKSEKDKVVKFVSDNCAAALTSSTPPAVFVVSSRDALNAKIQATPSIDPAFGSGAAMWKRSGFNDIESYFMKELGNQFKIRAKLLSPLGLIESSAKEMMEKLDNIQSDLDVDRRTISLLEEQMDVWVKDLETDVALDQSQIISEAISSMKPLLKFSESLNFVKKIHTSFDSTAFDKEVRECGYVENDPNVRIEQILEKSSARVEKKSKLQGRAVIDYLGKRPSFKSNLIIGNVFATADFKDVHRYLYQDLSKEVLEILSRFELTKEKEKLAESLKSTSIFFSIGQCFACSFGFFTFGFEQFVVPEVVGGAGSIIISFSSFAGAQMSHRRTSQQIKEKTEKIRTQIENAMNKVASHEIEVVRRKIMDGVAPYSRYVRSEQEGLDRIRRDCEDILLKNLGLRSRIKKC